MNIKEWNALARNEKVEPNDIITFENGELKETGLKVLRISETMATGVLTVFATAEPNFRCSMREAGKCPYHWRACYDLDFCTIEKKGVWDGQQ